MRKLAVVSLGVIATVCWLLVAADMALLVAGEARAPSYLPNGGLSLVPLLILAALFSELRHRAR